MKNKQETFTRLYRYLLREDLYYQAYKNLYANNGAATKGIDDDTADGFSEEKIQKIITALKDNTYQPKPVRRTYIEKSKGKKRPLGIPTFTDKLVQEVLRMVLEAVYEPLFLKCSHGFRPKRSCHTALSSIKKEFGGARWFVEGDIKGCFDNIDHPKLIELISKKVKDARIIQLIYKFLKAGYLENWQYHKTYSGAPQGGILSPLLSNIYLHELDKFVMHILKPYFDQPPTQKYTTDYNLLRSHMEVTKRRMKKLKGIEHRQCIDELKRTRALLLKTPSKSQTDKKLAYCRYADDFIIAINGNRTDCLWVKSNLSEFIHTYLKMELSEEKTLITHSSQYARFLNYRICVRRNSSIKPKGVNNCTRRTLMNQIDLSVPFEDRINKFILSKGIAKIRGDSFVSVHRNICVVSTALEIVSMYNAELRGLCNYYGLASDFYKFNYLSFLMTYSCLKSLGAKFQCSVGGVKWKFKDGKGGWCIPYETKAGQKWMYFAKYRDCKKSVVCSDVIVNAVGVYGLSVTSFEGRLKAKVCELCGSTQSGRYELHHVNKVKNLRGKFPWERAMIAKRRKTLAVCLECHHAIHNK